MKKIILITTVIITFIASFIIIKHITRSKTSAPYTIGILQTASHPALDAAREGFVEELKHLTGNKVDFIIQNAQGDVANAHAIAQQFHINKQLNGFFTIATLATQAMSSIEKEKPIIIAAVTDPDALGLIHPTTNVCGMKDMIDVKAEIEMVYQLLPNTKTIAFLYNNAEMNSIALVRLLKNELKAFNMTSLDVGIAQESDIPAAITMACRKADVLLCPTDNMMASAMELVASIALANKKPLIVCHNQAVKQGALAARGIDYKESGKKAGEIAYKVIVEGEKPYNLPITQPKTDKIYINEQTLVALGLSIPDVLKKDVVLI